MIGVAVILVVVAAVAPAVADGLIEYRWWENLTKARRGT